MFRIAIVLHDDRGLDADLLMYDPETGEVSDEYATHSSGIERPETAPTAEETALDGPDDPEPHRT
ncbi:hypothetical protein [Saliphagus infecundisoli]|uniref:hypothetical protein n=1 Tax=Saliphagus infecundisoli TaxID=1849069 RepID=UPI001CD52D5F|nr:hypothetical protein [Saliphagus infecundisoli]